MMEQTANTASPPGPLSLADDAREEGVTAGPFREPGIVLMTLHTPVTAEAMVGMLKLLERGMSDAEVWLGAPEAGKIVFYGSPRAPYVWPGEKRRTRSEER
jgi:hypothetical protein